MSQRPGEFVEHTDPNVDSSEKPLYVYKLPTVFDNAGLARLVSAQRRFFSQVTHPYAYVILVDALRQRSSAPPLPTSRSATA